MGTRADFYLGKDTQAEWLGSIAWDGYRDGITDAILMAKSADEFRAAVAGFIAGRDDGTVPDQGWPWPWNDSSTTDCSYWFFDGRCWEERSGCYAPADVPGPETDDDYKSSIIGCDRIQFPDMSARKNVTLGKRSGLIVIADRTPGGRHDR